MKKSISRWIGIITGIILFSGWLPAQQGTVRPTPEQDFAEMQRMVNEGATDDAVTLGYLILESFPAYHDVALFLARVEGWRGNFSDAYALVDSVIAASPRLLEAYETCLDLAFWDTAVSRLDQCGEKVLELGGDTAGVREKQELAQAALLAGTPPGFVDISYAYDHFSVPYVRNWHMWTVSGGIPCGRLTFIPGLSAGIMPVPGGTDADVQASLDTYVTLGKRTYMLGGYGYSPPGTRDYFPLHRAMAEWWYSFPSGFGFSGGLRYFFWNEHFLFPTLSLSQDLQPYELSLRTYLFVKGYGLSGSYYLAGKRYFSNRDHFVGLVLGFGTAPDEPAVVISDLERLDAYSGRLQYQHPLGRSVSLKLEAKYAYEEYLERTYRNRINFVMGVKINVRR